MVITPDFLPENKTLTPELVATLPKICLQSRGDLSTILAQAKNRHVMYVEHLAAVADVPQLANIAEESSIMVGFVVDCTGPADLEAIMDDPTGLIVGAVAHTPEVAALLRNALVPYVYDGSVLEQVIYAAARITDAIWAGVGLPSSPMTPRFIPTARGVCARPQPAAVVSTSGR